MQKRNGTGSVSEPMKALGETRSVIREIYEYSCRRKREIGEDRVFDFSLGNPSVPSPAVVSETLLTLLQALPPQKLHAYTSAAGDADVREAIAAYLNRTHGAKVSGSLIYLTAGAAAALTVSLHAVCNPGDEVVIVAPFFPEYRVFIEKAGAAVKVLQTEEPDFRIQADRLRSCLGKKTKAVILNSPNNPTGAVIGKEDLQSICGVLSEAEERFGHPIYLICDEPYRELVYGDVAVPFVPNFYADTLVCYSSTLR